MSPFHPLLQFESPSWRDPRRPLRISRLEAPLMRFVIPPAYEEDRVHVQGLLAIADNRSLGSLRRRILPATPTSPATVSLSGFLNLLATLFLSLPSHHFQMGDTHGILPSRDLVLDRSVTALPTVLGPLVVRSRPGFVHRNRLGVYATNLATGSVFITSTSGHFPATESIREGLHASAKPTDLPLLSFHLPMVCTSVLSPPL